MDEPTAETTPDPTTALAARLSRRGALRAYAPPALAAVVLAKAPDFRTSGRVTSNAGRGNGSEGNPDADPGNSGGHNNGGDGVVPPPGNGGGKKK